MLDYQCAGFGIKRLDVKKSHVEFCGMRDGDGGSCQSSWSAMARIGTRYAHCGQRTGGALLWKSRRVC